MATDLILEIEQNAEGSKLAILSPVDKDGNPDSGYRIAGPKAWGGSHNIARLPLTTDDLVSFIKGYVPEMIDQLK